MIVILMTCVPQWAKILEAEHCVDKEEAAHLDLCLLVPFSVLLHRHILVIPVFEHSRNVRAGDDVYHLLEPDSPLSELFWGDQLDDHYCQGVKEEEAHKSHQGPLSAESRVQVIIGSLGMLGVFKIPPLKLIDKIKYKVK